MKAGRMKVVQKKAKKAKKAKVDAVTGATFTSEALVKNVQKGLEYYEKNK